MKITDLLEFMEEHNIYVSKKYEYRNYYDVYYKDKIIFSVEKITWMRKAYYRVYINNTCFADYIDIGNKPYNLSENLYYFINLEYYHPTLILNENEL